jgi:hypothetical protein
MTRDQGLPPWRAPHSLELSSWGSAPILIQVPSVPAPVRALWRGTAFPTRIRTRRRRLRREVRLAGYAFLLASPLALAAATLPAVRPGSGLEAGGGDLAATQAPPVISISLEPAGVLPQRAGDTETAPVILPGYLLPDDGSEESVHAGS